MAAPPLSSAPPAGVPTALGGGGPLGGSRRRAAVLTATPGLVHVTLFLLAGAERRRLVLV
jgi:hypothetical protein